MFLLRHLESPASVRPTLLVGCFIYYAQMDFECEEIIFIFLNIEPCGSKNFKTLVLQLLFFFFLQPQFCYRHEKIFRLGIFAILRLTKVIKNVIF